MPLGVEVEEVVDKGLECFKEVALYTPSGAVTLQCVTGFLPAEATHLVLIFCCPLIVIVMKHRRHKRQRKVREEAGRLVT